MSERMMRTGVELVSGFPPSSLALTPIVDGAAEKVGVRLGEGGTGGHLFRGMGCPPAPAEDHL